MSRIHAACRASTETIAHAAASRSGVRFVIWPFSAATAASSSAMAFATKASWSVSASPMSNVGAGAAGVVPSAACERGDVVALVDQRGAGELGELTAQRAGADRALVERQLDALDAEQEAEDAQVLLARGRGARRGHRAETADRRAARGSSRHGATGREQELLACERAQHEDRHRMVNSHRKRDH